MSLGQLASCAVLLFALAGAGAISGHLLHQSAVDDGYGVRRMTETDDGRIQDAPLSDQSADDGTQTFDPDQVWLREPGQQRAASPEEAAAMIVRLFPDAGPETVEAWTDSFSGMDAAAIEELLQQRRSMGPLAALSAPESDSLMESITATAGSSTMIDATPVSHSAEIQESVTGEQDPTAWCESNLKRLNEPGYHRALLLGQSVRRTFEPARSAVTGHPLHVSLPEHETHLFFELENGQLTRRGDFCRLSGGKLGIVTQSGELPLRSSPIVDATSGTVRIMSHGEICLLVDTGSAASDVSSRGDVQRIGQVPVVAITDLSQLISVDGVFFTSHEPGRHPDPMTIEMRPGCLELSNVDANAEIGQLRAWRATAAP
jgi:hypothetical protein